jgi:hypothetical protein
VLHKHLSVEVLQLLQRASSGGPSSHDVVESYKLVVEARDSEEQLVGLTRLLAVDALTDVGALPLGPRCVPDNFVATFLKMFEQIDDKLYLAAENTYLEVAIGAGSWHLGLCNGGEVHMRKNMAKLQRGHVTHILNNEKAMKLLHTVKRIIQWAQILMSS